MAKKGLSKKTKFSITKKSFIVICISLLIIVIGILAWYKYESYKDSKKSKTDSNVKYETREYLSAPPPANGN